MHRTSPVKMSHHWSNPSAAPRLRLPVIINLCPATEVSVNTSEARIAEFYAANAASNRTSLTDTRLPNTAFIFARDDFGNLFYLCTDKEGVYYWDHELEGDGDIIFKSFDDFWKALHTALPDHNPCRRCGYDLRAHHPGKKMPRMRHSHPKHDNQQSTPTPLICLTRSARSLKVSINSPISPSLLGSAIRRLTPMHLSRTSGDSSNPFNIHPTDSA